MRLSPAVAHMFFDLPGVPVLAEQAVSIPWLQTAAITVEGRLLTLFGLREKTTT